MHDGSCHCGAVRLTLPSTPTVATKCNCSLCRRGGGPWVYFEFGTVKITGREYEVVKVGGGQKVIPKKLTVVVSGDEPGTLSYERNDDHVQKEVVAMEAKQVPDVTMTTSAALFFQNGFSIEVADVYDQARALLIGLT